MCFPQVNTRIEKSDECISQGIIGTRVRTLLKVALRTGQAQVIERIAATMLFRANVFDVEGSERTAGGRQLAVFAAMVRTSPDKLLHF
jgi:hypothetical protein